MRFSSGKEFDMYVYIHIGSGIYLRTLGCIGVSVGCACVACASYKKYISCRCRCRCMYSCGCAYSLRPRVVCRKKSLAGCYCLI